MIILYNTISIFLALLLMRITQHIYARLIAWKKAACFRFYFFEKLQYFHPPTKSRYYWIGFEFTKWAFKGSNGGRVYFIGIRNKEIDTETCKP